MCILHLTQSPVDLLYHRVGRPASVFVHKVCTDSLQHISVSGFDERQTKVDENHNFMKLQVETGQIDPGHNRRVKAALWGFRFIQLQERLYGWVLRHDP